MITWLKSCLTNASSEGTLVVKSRFDACFFKKFNRSPAVSRELKDFTKDLSWSKIDLTTSSTCFENKPSLLNRFWLIHAFWLIVSNGIVILKMNVHSEEYWVNCNDKNVLIVSYTVFKKILEHVHICTV